MRKNPQAGPIVTLTSDFGLADAYVAAMKGAILCECPGARLIDISHGIQPQDVPGGSFVLERALDAFEPGTIHLAVVDPGVGTRRKILVVQIHRQTVVCPDNGLITWSWRRWGSGRARELTWRPRGSSSTFQGRDIMAPVAGMLAGGGPVEKIARRTAKPILLNIAPAKRSAKSGKIVYIDRFGNAITNLPRGVAGQVFVAGRSVGRIRRTYADVAAGNLVALIGSAELLEIAVRGGSAARDLNLRVGDEVRIE